MCLSFWGVLRARATWYFHLVLHNVMVYKTHSKRQESNVKNCTFSRNTIISFNLLIFIGNYCRSRDVDYTLSSIASSGYEFFYRACDYRMQLTDSNHVIHNISVTVCDMLIARRPENELCQLK